MSAPLVERGRTGGSAVTPENPRSASGDQQLQPGLEPEQLTLEGFQEWDGQLPVPVGIIPF